MARAERTEVRDGREYTVVKLPQDPALTPSAARKRALWSSLDKREKAAYFAQAKAKARKRRRRKRRRS